MHAVHNAPCTLHSIYRSVVELCLCHFQVLAIFFVFFTQTFPAQTFYCDAPYFFRLFVCFFLLFFSGVHSNYSLFARCTFLLIEPISFECIYCLSAQLCQRNIKLVPAYCTCCLLTCVRLIIVIQSAVCNMQASLHKRRK